MHSLALIMGQGSVRTVYVDGRRVLDEGRATLVKEREVYRQVCDSVRVRADRLSVDAGPAWPVVRD